MNRSKPNNLIEIYDKIPENIIDIIFIVDFFCCNFMYKV